MTAFRMTVFVAAAMLAANLASAADVEQGAKNFRQCGTCHDLAGGKNKIGPSLQGRSEDVV